MEANFQHGGITIISEQLDKIGALSLKFRGFLDKSTVKPSEEYVMRVIGGMEGDVLVFDFGGLSYINSEGIGFLMMVSTHMTKNDKSLFILNPTAQVVDIFEAIGLPNAIACFKTMSELEAHISSL